MGSCASKFNLGVEDSKNAPTAAHDKDEFPPVVSEAKLVSPIQEKSTEQQNLEISKGIETDIIEETTRGSLSSLLHENEGKLAVEVAGRSPEKAKPELQGSENIISEQDEAVHHIEAGDSVPQTLSGVTPTAVVDETSEKKKHLNDTIIIEAQKPGVSLTPEIVVEPSEGEKPHPGKAGTFVEDEARDPISMPETPPMLQPLQERIYEDAENTLSHAPECVDTGIPKTGLMKGDSLDTNAKLCLTGEETAEHLGVRRGEFSAAAIVTGEPGNENSKVKTGEDELPEQMESPPEIDTAAKSPEILLSSVAEASATTPEPVETEDLQFEVSKCKIGQKPEAETEHFKEKCRSMQNQKTTTTLAGRGESVGSVIGVGVEGEEGGPLLPDEAPLESVGGEIHGGERERP